MQSAVFETGELSPKVQDHLTRVYASLFVGLLCASVGAYLDMFYLQMGGLLSNLAGIVFLVLTMSTPNNGANQNSRFLYFSMFCLLQGVSLGPLLSVVVAINESIILMALSSTSLIFLAFTLSAHFSPRRSFLYLGGQSPPTLTHSISIMASHSFSLSLYYCLLLLLLLLLLLHV